MSQTTVEHEIAPAEARQILARLCEQNHNAELISNAVGSPPVRAKIRLLQLSRDTLVVDYPAVDGDPVRLAEREPVEIRFVWADQFFSFVAPVRERVRGTPRGSATADLLVLDFPEGLERVQRRGSFRVSLLDLPAPPITFTHTGRNSEPLTGAIVELSETGGRAMVADRLLPEIQNNELFHVSIELPGGAEPLTLPGRIERVQHYADDGVAMIGISWQLDHSWPEARRTQARLAKFLATQQRRALRQHQ